MLLHLITQNFAFVQNTIDIATGAINDPYSNTFNVNGVAVTGGTYALHGPGSPGANFVAIPADFNGANGFIGGVHGGNKFYALKE